MGLNQLAADVFKTSRKEHEEARRGQAGGSLTANSEAESLILRVIRIAPKGSMAKNDRPGDPTARHLLEGSKSFVPLKTVSRIWGGGKV